MSGETLTAGEAPELAALFAKRPQLIKPGLARIEAALAELGAESLLATPTVLIGGTNGKGTTSGFLWQLTSALGWEVGLFTSPHLQHFAERIQLSHQRVDNQLLVRALADLQQQLPPALYAELSFFEVNTLLALSVFQAARSDLNVLEVGLGGRWDSTNATRPCLSLITSIGLDHQQWLGSTTAAIAFEKAGIMRQACPVLWGGDAAGDAAAVATLRQEAATKQALLWEQGREFRADEQGLSIALPGCAPVHLPWPKAAAHWPPFLRANFTNAAAALVWLLSTPSLAAARARLPSISPQELARTAIAALDRGEVRTPPCMRARFERLEVPTQGGTRPLLLDVCHNVDGARALIAGLRATVKASMPLPGLVSILADKDCDEVLDLLRTVLQPLRLFASTSERSWSAGRLAPRHRDLPFFGSFAEAWAALEAGDAAQRLTVVCGSVHAVGEVSSALGLGID